MANKTRNAAKEQFWRDALKRFSASGLSVRAFCRRENLAESAFYFWRREIARRDEKPATRGKTPRRRPATRGKTPRRSTALPAFLPVRVTDAASHPASIAVELAGGRVLRLPESMSVQRVAELVLAIESPYVEAAAQPGTLARRHEVARAER